MNDFSDKLIAAIQNKKPFVLFRKPDENTVWLYADDLSVNNRFILCSFDSKANKEISDNYPASISQNEFAFDLNFELQISGTFNSVNQHEYKELIEKTIDQINRSKIKKIVISRIKSIENQNYNLLKSFSELLKQHPSTMVYLWHNPNFETWLGASPELLLEKYDNRLKTVSLAGTKSPDSVWTPKEIEEQQIVTDYILEAIKGYEQQNVSEVQTVSAGKFQHLKTFISAIDNPERKTEELLKKLHPTPAVCGFPKKDAFDFILKNEFHSREFYAGYIGVENQDSKIYFVNLRCARFFKNSIRIFVGGGITIDSQPEKEWLETELKSGTIINALRT